MAKISVNRQRQMLTKQEKDQSLKYLAFVQVAAIQALVTFMNLYMYAKERSGPLKPRVENLEGTVKNVVRPVYDSYQSVPFQILKFVDRKVDESVEGLDCRLPRLVKQVSSQAFSVAQYTPSTARAVASEVQQSGVKETATGLAKNVYAKCEPKAKEIYSKYEPKMEECAVSAWRRLNQLPLFPRVAQVAVPTAAFCAEKYNRTVVSTTQQGYKLSYYLPLVPSEKIAKVFQTPEAASASSD